MNAHFTYLAVDLGCLLVPLLVSFHPAIAFHRQLKFFLPASFITAFLFIIWDSIFTKWGVWSFHPGKVIGIDLFGLPLEEHLFFLCIPYACAFTFACFEKFFGERLKNGKWDATVVLIIGLILIAAGFSFSKRLYTFTSLSFCGASFVLLALFRWQYLRLFLVTYIVLIIPQLISDGVLTGSWISEPVVIYNPAHHLNMRIGTVPIEDIFYGLLMMVMNVWGWTSFRKSAVHKIATSS